MIGDNPDTDIRGALGAGWHAVWYHPDRAFHGISCPAGAIEISDLAECKSVLK